MNLKSILRKNMLAILKQQSKDTRVMEEEYVITQVLQSKEWKTATHIALTYPTEMEFNLLSLIENSPKKEKKFFYIPRMISNHQLEWIMWEEHTQFLKNRFGIMEPIPNPHEKKRDSKQMNLVIVPGVVFHPSGHRIGYGGGYFDRILVQDTFLTISLCYSVQVQENLWPVEEHDKQVQQLFFYDKGDENK